MIKTYWKTRFLSQPIADELEYWSDNNISKDSSFLRAYLWKIITQVVELKHEKLLELSHQLVAFLLENDIVCGYYPDIQCNLIWQSKEKRFVE